MSKDVFLVIRGTLHWAKVLGSARPHTGLPKYNKGPYWSVDVTPNAASRKALAEAGIVGKPKLKEPKAGPKEDRTESFLVLRVLENKTDGGKNSPPKVLDASNNPWPEDRLIGNGTVADVKVKIKDYGEDSEMGVYLQAIRILNLVPYASNDFAPLSSDDEFFSEGSEIARLPDDMEPVGDDDLNDDVPFDFGN